MKKTKILVVCLMTCVIILGLRSIVQGDRYENSLASMEETVKKIKKGSEKPYLFCYLFLGVDEKMGKQIRGRNDITMLAFVHADRVEVYGFPRETLIYIQERGMYMMNGLYPFTTAPGAVRTLEDNLNIDIDSYYVIDIPKARQLYTDLLNNNLPSILKNLFKRQVKDERWVRHRSSFTFEAARQLRFQKYLEKMINVAKLIPLSDKRLQSIFFDFYKNKVATDIHTSGEFKHIVKQLLDKPIEWALWSGQYRRYRFNYPWFHHKERYVYELNAKNYRELSFKDLSYRKNPYTFDAKKMVTFDTNVCFNVKGLVDWKQDCFMEYGTNGLKDISSEYKVITNKSGIVCYILKTVK